MRATPDRAARFLFRKNRICAVVRNSLCRPGICAAKNCTNANCKQHARLSVYPFSSLSHVAVISSMISWQRDSGILMSVPALTRSAFVGRPLPITDVACSPR